MVYSHFLQKLKLQYPLAHLVNFEYIRFSNFLVGKSVDVDEEIGRVLLRLLRFVCPAAQAENVKERGPEHQREGGEAHEH